MINTVLVIVLTVLTVIGSIAAFSRLLLTNTNLSLTLELLLLFLGLSLTLSSLRYVGLIIATLAGLGILLETKIK